MNSKRVLFTSLVAGLAVTLTACAGGGAAATGGTGGGEPVENTGQTFNIRFAHAGSEATLVHRAIEIISQEMEANSDGQIQVTIFPNAQLGADSTVISSLQTGDIEMTSVNTAALAPFVSELSVFSVPFAFPSEEVAYRVLDGEFGQRMSNELESRMGVIGLGFLESTTYRQLTSNRPIRTPDDLGGLRIRVMDNPIQIRIWEALGAAPTPIPFPELYTALQQGTVDAQENPIELMTAMRFYEVQGYLTLTNHVFTTSQVLISPHSFNQMPADLQRVVRDAARTGIEYQRELFQQEIQGLMQHLRDSGVEIIELTDAETAMFVERSEPSIEFIREQIGSELVDDLLQAIENAR